MIGMVVIINIFFWFYPSFAMEEFCQLIPYQNGKACDGGPLIDLKVAFQSRLFKDAYDDIYGNNPSLDDQIITFQLHDCDASLAWEFAECLTKQFKAKNYLVSDRKKIIEDHIARLSTDTLIRLYNMADSVQIPSLERKLFRALSESENKCHDIAQLRSLNINLQRKIASHLIAVHKYDVAFLSAYCEQIRQISHVIERQGFLSELVEWQCGTKDIRYFNDKTNIFLSTISSGDPAKIDSIWIEKYDGYVRKGSLLAYVGNTFFNKEISTVIDMSTYNIASIQYVCANDDETLFICDCSDSENHKKKIVIDRVNACVIDKYEDYCFAHDDNELYVREKNNMYILKIAKDYYAIDKKTKKFNLPPNENIILFASSKKDFFVFVTYDEEENLSYIYCNNPGKRSIQCTPVIRRVYSLCVANNGDVLISCMNDLFQNPDKSWERCDIYITNMQEVRLKSFNSQKFVSHADAVNSCGKWFVNDGLLHIRRSLWSNEYDIYNSVTNNRWQFKASAHNSIPAAHGEKIICSYEDYQDKIRSTSVVTYVDNNMKNFAQDLLEKKLPLVLCTIASQQADRIALDDQEYEEYNALPQSTKTIIDTLYTVTKKGYCAELKGAAYSFYKSIRKPLTSFLVVGSLLGVMVALSIKYPWILNNDLAKGIELILKL